MRFFHVVFLSALLLSSASVVVAEPVTVTEAEQNGLSGTVTFRIKSVDVGVGYTWGEGVLAYEGKNYPFTIRGGNIAAIGYSKIEGQGKVFNLRHLHDFDGVYGAVSGEATLGTGQGGQLLRNSNGVSLSLESTTEGLRLAGGFQGLTFNIKD